MPVPFIFQNLPAGTVPASELDADFAYVISSAAYSDFNVIGYGADPTGVADSTVAIQAAATAAGAAGGGRVFMPQGNYSVDATITLPEGVSLVGANWNSTNLKTTSAFGTSSSPVIALSKSNNELRDFKISAANAATPGCTGILLESGTANLVIDTIHLLDCAIGLWGQYVNDGRIGNMRIECPLNGTGILEGRGGAGIYFSECLFHKIAIIPSGQTGYGWIIDYNSFSNQRVQCTVQGGVNCVLIEATVQPDEVNYYTPQGHWFSGDCNFDHAQNAVVQINTGWGIFFTGGTMSGCQAGPGLLVNISGNTFPNAIDGIQCIGVQIVGNGDNGVYLQSGGNARFVGCLIQANGFTTNNSFAGIRVGASFGGGLEIKSCCFAPSAASSGTWNNNVNVQTYAIQLDSSSLSNIASWGVSGTLAGSLQITGCDVTRQLTGAISDASTPTLFKRIEENPGYNPVGAHPITVTASPFTYTAGASKEFVNITAGTVSSIVVGGVTLATSTGVGVLLGPQQSVVVTYSGAPTMKGNIL